MTAEGIIEALLEMEQKAQKAEQNILRGKNNVPARIEAEVEYVRQKIFNEFEESKRQIQEESIKSTEMRIQQIQEESAKQLADLENDFAKNKNMLRAELFKKAITWTTML